MRKADARAEQPEIDREKDRDEAHSLVSRALRRDLDEEGRRPEQESRWISDDVRVGKSQQLLRQKKCSRGQRSPIGLGDLSAEPGRCRGRNGGQEGQPLPGYEDAPIAQRRQGENPEEKGGDGQAFAQCQSAARNRPAGRTRATSGDGKERVERGQREEKPPQPWLPPVVRGALPGVFERGPEARYEQHHEGGDGGSADPNEMRRDGGEADPPVIARRCGWAFEADRKDKPL